MQQFSLVYNNLFVFLEPVDEPRPAYAGYGRWSSFRASTSFRVFAVYLVSLAIVSISISIALGDGTETRSSRPVVLCKNYLISEITNR